MPARAGYLLGTTRIRQPGASGALPRGRTASISGGVSASLPAQNGQGPAAPPRRAACRSLGRAARPGATIVSLPLTGLRRSSPPPVECARRSSSLLASPEGEGYSASSEASSDRTLVVFPGAVELARVAQLVVLVVQHGAHLAPQADVLLEVLRPDRRGALAVERAGVAHLVLHDVHRLARALALVDAPVGVEQQLLHVALDGDLEARHLLGLVVDEDAVLPVGQLEHLVERLPAHDLADPGFAREALLDQALAERLELLLVVGERRVLDEGLGELLLAEAAGLDQARAQLLVGDRQGDAFHAAVDEVDEAVLLEVADLEHAGGGVLRKELQDARQVEPVDGSLEQHRLVSAGFRRPFGVSAACREKLRRRRREPCGGGRPGQIDPASAARLYCTF